MRKDALPAGLSLPKGAFGVKVWALPARRWAGGNVRVPRHPPCAAGSAGADGAEPGRGPGPQGGEGRGGGLGGAVRPRPGGLRAA